MPKLGMEPVRRAALVDATIDCIGRAGSLDVTVGQIAKAAGMSSALAHHYFGAKDQIFLAAMRHILTQYGDGVRKALAGVKTPRARLEAIVQASFDTTQFRRPVISAWLNFYVQAHMSKDAERLLVVYQRRLRSNLMHELRPLIGARAGDGADTVAALIDGFYIRAALGAGAMDGAGPARAVLEVMDMLIGGAQTHG